MTGTALADWLARLASFSPHEIELGLDRIAAVHARLDLPRPPKVLTIAGTNGKGSTAALVTNCLVRAGIRTGTYTSPHIHVYNERIRINGEEVSDAGLVDAFERIETARGDVPLTYFEYGTLAALVVFAAEAVDVAVLEVGLGGRLDAVNLLDADAAIVTNVSLDHCDWLGEDTELIGREKAGVFRQDRPAVFGSKDVPGTVLDYATGIDADLVLAGSDYCWERDGDKWSWRGRRLRLDDLPMPALAGEHQLQNAAGAFALLESAALDVALAPDVVAAALQATDVAGRMQRVMRRNEWLFDVAHNAAASQALSASLGHDSGERVAIVGVLDDKDAEAVITPLCSVVDRWIAVQPDSPRGLEAAELARIIANASDRPCLVAGSFDEAIAEAERGLTESGCVLVTGSFFTVGPVQRALGLYSPSPDS